MLVGRLGASHVLVLLSFQQPTFQNFITNNELSAAWSAFHVKHVVVCVASSEHLKCRLLKRLSAHPMTHVSSHLSYTASFVFYSTTCLIRLIEFVALFVVFKEHMCQTSGDRQVAPPDIYVQYNISFHCIICYSILCYFILQYRIIYHIML